MATLENLKPLARRSFNNISFNPDRRGEDTINSYSSELDEDIEKIKSQGASDEQAQRYKEGYSSKLSSWLSSQSNCASSFICGPSNFPVQRMQKRNRWSDNHYQNFRAWRDKVLNAYTRYEKKAKIENAGGELQVAINKLKMLEDTQSYMKRINAAHKAYLKNPVTLLNSDLSEHEQKIVVQYVPQYSWIKHPFAPYQLTNNNAMIKNTKIRIEELQKKEEAASGENKVIPFPGGVCELNYELDRVTIKHDQKPDSSVITSLKQNGFRWSPHYNVWMRKITGNALHSASRVLNIEIK